MRDPDRVKIYGDKAVMHQELARMGIEMPRTLFWQPGRTRRVRGAGLQMR
jgi:glutathione synthase/RimK-type ligase-like ATP-grasp enzyme